MKTKLIPALFIALFVHALFLSLFLFLISKQNQSDQKPLHKEKHFGITLSEEDEMSDILASSPPSQTHLSQPGPLAPQSVPIQPIKNPDPTPATQFQQITEADRDSLPFSVLHHYGDEFFTLSAGEQHYIIDNLQKIRKINEIVGTRLLRERPDDVDPMDNNVVEFTLNPNGSISDLHLEKNRIGTPLDELTLQTINLAHPKYPKPDQPTKIRIKVYIIIK